jgi:hypothetical protein
MAPPPLPAKKVSTDRPLAPHPPPKVEALSNSNPQLPTVPKKKPTLKFNRRNSSKVIRRNSERLVREHVRMETPPEEALVDADFLNDLIGEVSKLQLEAKPEEEEEPEEEKRDPNRLTISMADEQYCNLLDVLSSFE